MPFFLRRILWPVATLVVMSLILVNKTESNGLFDDVNLTFLFYSFGFGALVSVSASLHRADRRMQGVGCFGWVLGSLLGFFLNDQLPSYPDIWFLVIPAVAATAIQLKSYLDREVLLSSPILPVLVSYLVLTVYVADYLERNVARSADVSPILVIASITAVIQIVFALLPKRVLQSELKRE